MLRVVAKGASSSGKGGCISTNINVVSGQKLYIYVGGQGKTDGKSGFNGGGKGSKFCNPYSGICSWAGSGGGATDIRQSTDISTRLVVAGGGGGGMNGGSQNSDKGGNGGGQNGGGGGGWSAGGLGGTLTAGGNGGCYVVSINVNHVVSTCGFSGSLGKGGDGVTSEGSSGYMGGGGGGGLKYYY